jgi:CRP-like cAMP-binding protein
VAAGRRLTRETAIGSEFFVIESGRAGVSRGGRAVAVLGPGDHFGEVALLTPQRRRTATVVALDDMVVRVFDRREFAELLAREPATEVRLLRSVIARIVTTDPVESTMLATA